MTFFFKSKISSFPSPPPPHPFAIKTKSRLNDDSKVNRHTSTKHLPKPILLSKNEIVPKKREKRHIVHYFI